MILSVRGDDRMRKHFENGTLMEAVNSGQFGDYLVKPLSAKDRMEVVGKNLFFFRRQSGLSQKDLCKVLECAPQTYSGYEKGLHEPPIEVLVRLAYLYDISLDFLLGKRHEGEWADIENYEDEKANIDDNERIVELQTEIFDVKKRIAELEAKIKSGELMMPE